MKSLSSKFFELVEPPSNNNLSLALLNGGGHSAPCNFYHHHQTDDNNPGGSGDGGEKVSPDQLTESKIKIPRTDGGQRVGGQHTGGLRVDTQTRHQQRETQSKITRPVSPSIAESLVALMNATIKIKPSNNSRSHSTNSNTDNSSINSEDAYMCGCGMQFSMETFESAWQRHRKCKAHKITREPHTGRNIGKVRYTKTIRKANTVEIPLGCRFSGCDYISHATSLQHIEKHCMRHVRGQVIKISCLMCGCDFANEDQIDKHLRTEKHLGPGSEKSERREKMEFKCIRCSATTKTQKSIELHCRKEHNICVYCASRVTKKQAHSKKEFYKHREHTHFCYALSRVDSRGMELVDFRCPEPKCHKLKFGSQEIVQRHIEEEHLLQEKDPLAPLPPQPVPLKNSMKDEYESHSNTSEKSYDSDGGSSDNEKTTTFSSTTQRTDGAPLISHRRTTQFHKQESGTDSPSYELGEIPSSPQVHQLISHHHHIRSSSAQQVLGAVPTSQTSSVIVRNPPKRFQKTTRPSFLHHHSINHTHLFPQKSQHENKQHHSRKPGPVVSAPTPPGCTVHNVPPGVNSLSSTPCKKPPTPKRTVHKTPILPTATSLQLPALIDAPMDTPPNSSPPHSDRNGFVGTCIESHSNSSSNNSPYSTGTNSPPPPMPRTTSVTKEEKKTKKRKAKRIGGVNISFAKQQPQQHQVQSSQMSTSALNNGNDIASFDALKNGIAKGLADLPRLHIEGMEVPILLMTPEHLQALQNTVMKRDGVQQAPWISGPGFTKPRHVREPSSSKNIGDDELSNFQANNNSGKRSDDKKMSTCLATSQNEESIVREFEPNSHEICPPTLSHSSQSSKRRKLVDDVPPPPPLKKVNKNCIDDDEFMAIAPPKKDIDYSQGAISHILREKKKDFSVFEIFNMHKFTNI